MNIKEQITGIIKPVIENMGYEFIDITYGKIGGSWHLQVFADKSSGFSINDCTDISKQVGYELDRYPDIMKHSYFLEVSSPGIDSPLKTIGDFMKNIKKEVEITLYKPVDNTRKIQGQILQADEDGIVIGYTGGSKKKLALDNVAKARIKVHT